MPYLDLERGHCFYAGNNNCGGMPVLFCHGSGGGHHHWLYQLQSLEKICNPVAVDLPGHGRSEGKPAESIDQYAAWLYQVIQSLGLKSPLVAGHSMGGAVTLTMGLRYSSSIGGLILLSTGCRLRVLPDLLDSLKAGRIPAQLNDYLYSPDVPEALLRMSRRELENADPSIYYADLNACNNFNVTEKLSSIALPTLIICGSDDRLTPPKYSHFMKDTIPCSSLEIIPGAGHMVMLEQPDKVNRVISRFVMNQNIHR
ncbi:MAG: alpha/beta hydrolase [Bacillota bacterium]|nr:alpha/beta hydrolase [Bacillota bacterium]